MDKSRKILVIDDESIVREPLRVVLESMGCEVLEDDSGLEGIQRCAMEHPDLVLLDINMPVMDGFEACARLKQEASTRDIPVIFISGAAGYQDRIQAFKAGAVDYVSKPFSVDEVRARVGVHLALGEQREHLEKKNEQLRHALEMLEETNRKLVESNEKLQESEALKSHFISHMRNEINNPFNAVMGLNQELDNLQLQPEQRRKIAGMIMAEALDLDFQFRNIVCAAELEAGHMAPCAGPVDIPSLLREIMDAFSRKAQDCVLNVSLECSSLQAPFWTDAEMFRIITSNLLSNAIKFNRGEGNVCIRACLKEEKLCLEIENHGPGMPREDGNWIFQQPFPLEAGNARKLGGQGLGLTVVKAVTDLLGGSIALINTGEGCIFQCLLPKGVPFELSQVAALDGNLFLFDDAEVK